MPRINKRFVDTAVSGRHYDSDTTGFGLWVSPNGQTRSYFIEYRTGYGRAATKRRMVLGKHGVLTPFQARQMAQDALAAVRAGGDPLASKRASGGGTVAALADEWLAEIEGKRKARTAYDYGRIMAKHVLPEIGDRAVAKVTRPDIAKLHHGMRRTPAEANHALRVMSSFFVWCERRGHRPDGSNPCRHVERNREIKRERFLSPKEMRRLGRAIAAGERCGFLSPWAAGALRLLIFTGARLGEILHLKWEHVDGDLLRLPDSKTGAKTIHLNAPAREVLAAIPRVAENPYVCVGAERGKHIVNIEKRWRRIRKAALLTDVRIHDLRHSFASVAVSGGGTLPLIGGLLGHSQPATTARYAHLYDDAKAALAEQVGKRIDEMMRPRRHRSDRTERK
jgi:integrase